MDPRLAWWVIYGEDLYAALHRVHTGDDPELVWIELFANCEDADVP